MKLRWMYLEIKVVKTKHESQKFKGLMFWEYFEEHFNTVPLSWSSVKWGNLVWIFSFLMTFQTTAAKFCYHSLQYRPSTHICCLCMDHMHITNKCCLSVGYSHSMSLLSLLWLYSVPPWFLHFRRSSETSLRRIHTVIGRLPSLHAVTNQLIFQRSNKIAFLTWAFSLTPVCWQMFICLSICHPRLREQARSFQKNKKLHWYSSLVGLWIRSRPFWKSWIHAVLKAASIWAKPCYSAYFPTNTKRASLTKPMLFKWKKKSFSFPVPCYILLR